ncbi:hypothetical protein EVAR_75869_1 [Eumeta japonica]|uniref:Uncharacterized protein n=1 Tax=Eumeta variegata TaxID=151549 RepID=A0A4C1TDC3_EUMVA|nr:hypothetical protein EVAR_75869_1 [Eumeta japonica]
MYRIETSARCKWRRRGAGVAARRKSARARAAGGGRSQPALYGPPILDLLVVLSKADVIKQTPEPRRRLHRYAAYARVLCACSVLPAYGFLALLELMTFLIRRVSRFDLRLIGMISTYMHIYADIGARAPAAGRAAPSAGSGRVYYLAVARSVVLIFE